MDPKKIIPFTDESKMPFGMHRDKPMSDVPDGYLWWLYNQKDGKNHLIYPELWAYIMENLDAIKENLK